MKGNTAFIGANQGTRRDSDFYPTPSFAVRNLLAVEPLCGDIWEPASGDGSISMVLEEKFTTISTELREGNSVYGRGGGRLFKMLLLTQSKHKNNIHQPAVFSCSRVHNSRQDVSDCNRSDAFKIKFFRGAKKKDYVC